MKIYIGADHAGFQLKNSIIRELEAGNISGPHNVEDLGAIELEPGDDYPVISQRVARAVADDNGSIGIIVGGSGQGEAMAANRIDTIRAAVFYGPVAPKQAIDIEGSESTDPYMIVRLEKIHNNANVLALGARFLSENEALTAVRVFIDTEFKNEERHIRRIAMF